MTTTTQTLVDLVVTLLDGATDAGESVYSPGDWPTYAGEYPFIRVRGVAEEKESLGRFSPSEFWTTSTVQLVARVSSPALISDGGATANEVALWALQRQIEVAVINAPAIARIVQNFPKVRSRVGFNSDGEEHLAELVMEIDLEYFQGADDFAQPNAVPLTTVAVTATGAPAGPDAGLTITLPQD